MASVSIALKGICCPRCGGSRARVLEARAGKGYIRRRHLCLNAACATVETTRRIAGRDVRVKGVRWTSYQFYSTRRGAIALPADTRAIRRIDRASE